MQIFQDFIYHVYNQANNKERIFLDDEDYVYFLGRARRWIAESADILAYCVMPNHFHFLVHMNSKSVEMVKVGSLSLKGVSNGLRLLQSQYAQYFNRKYDRSGSIFRPKAKWKLLNSSTNDHATSCFNYIHDNPVRAGLSKSNKSWAYSSLAEFLGRNDNVLVNQQLAKDYIKVDWEGADFDDLPV